MIILPCLPIFFSGSYLTTFFLLVFAFGLLFSIGRSLLR